MARLTDGTNTIKLTGITTPISSDSDNTVATKEYVDNHSSGGAINDATITFTSSGGNINLGDQNPSFTLNQAADADINFDLANDVIVNASVSGNTLTLTKEDDTTVTFTNTNTQLTDEQVQDIVGAMVSGNTESNISVTYDDANGKLDFAGVSLTDFGGADGTNAGSAGQVPAPAATDDTKFLKGDGTWATPAGGGGSNTTYNISAQAVTDGADLRLSDSDNNNDDVSFLGGDNVTVSRTDANTITISSDTPLTAGTAIDISDSDVISWDATPNEVRQVGTYTEIGPWTYDSDGSASQDIPDGQYFISQIVAGSYTAIVSLDDNEGNTDIDDDIAFLINSHSVIFSDGTDDGYYYASPVDHGHGGEAFGLEFQSGTDIFASNNRPTTITIRYNTDPLFLLATETRSGLVPSHPRGIDSPTQQILYGDLNWHGDAQTVRDGTTFYHPNSSIAANRYTQIDYDGNLTVAKEGSNTLTVSVDTSTIATRTYVDNAVDDAFNPFDLIDLLDDQSNTWSRAATATNVPQGDFFAGEASNGEVYIFLQGTLSDGDNPLSTDTIKKEWTGGLLKVTYLNPLSPLDTANGYGYYRVNNIIIDEENSRVSYTFYSDLAYIDDIESDANRKDVLALGGTGGDGWSFQFRPAGLSRPFEGTEPGLVPESSSSDNTRFLRGDGSWTTVYEDFSLEDIASYPYGNIALDNDAISQWTAVPSVGSGLSQGQFVVTTGTNRYSLRFRIQDLDPIQAQTFGILRVALSASTGFYKIVSGEITGETDYVIVVAEDAISGNDPLSSLIGTELAGNITNVTIQADHKESLVKLRDLYDVDDTALGSEQDGFVLSWDNDNSEWTAVQQSGGGSLTIQDEGTALTTDATTLNFTGSGVTASGTGATKTINIPGGGSGWENALDEDNFTTIRKDVNALDWTVDVGAAPTEAYHVEVITFTDFYRLRFRREDLNPRAFAQVMFVNGNPYFVYEADFVGNDEDIVSIDLNKTPLSGTDSIDDLVADDTVTIRGFNNDLLADVYAAGDGLTATSDTDNTLVTLDVDNPVPDYTSSNAGQVLSVASGGDSLEWVDDGEKSNTEIDQRIIRFIDVEDHGSNDYTPPSATAEYAISIGDSSTATAEDAIAIGSNVTATASNAVSLGINSDATATDATAIGAGSQATHAYSTAVGYQASTDRLDEVRLGRSNTYITVEPDVAGTESLNNQLATKQYVDSRVDIQTQVVKANNPNILEYHEDVATTDTLNGPVAADDPDYEVAISAGTSANDYLDGIVVTLHSSALNEHNHLGAFTTNPDVGDGDTSGIFSGTISSEWAEINDTSTKSPLISEATNVTNNTHLDTLTWQWQQGVGRVRLAEDYVLQPRFGWAVHDDDDESSNVQIPSYTVTAQIVKVNGDSTQLYGSGNDLVVLGTSNSVHQTFNSTHGIQKFSTAVENSSSGAFHRHTLTIPSSDTFVELAEDDIIGVRYNVQFGEEWNYDVEDFGFWIYDPLNGRDADTLRPRLATDYNTHDYRFILTSQGDLEITDNTGVNETTTSIYDLSAGTFYPATLGTGTDIAGKFLRGDSTWQDVSTDIGVQDEGVNLATNASTLNFVGAGVTAAGTGSTKTITIPGGSPDQNLFSSVRPQHGDNIIASSTTDHIDLADDDIIRVEGNDNNNSITFSIENDSITESKLAATGVQDNRFLRANVDTENNITMSWETVAASNLSNVYTTVVAGTTSLTADGTDTLNVSGGNAITVTGDPSSDTMTVAVTDGAINTAELADEAVTIGKIADNTVDTSIQDLDHHVRGQLDGTFTAISWTYNQGGGTPSDNEFNLVHSSTDNAYSLTFLSEDVNVGALSTSSFLYVGSNTDVSIYRITSVSLNSGETQVTLEVADKVAYGGSTDVLDDFIDSTQDITSVNLRVDHKSLQDSIGYDQLVAGSSSGGQFLRVNADNDELEFATVQGGAVFDTDDSLVIDESVDPHELSVNLQSGGGLALSTTDGDEGLYVNAELHQLSNVASSVEDATDRQILTYSSTGLNPANLWTARSFALADLSNVLQASYTNNDVYAYNASESRFEATQVEDLIDFNTSSPLVGETLIYTVDGWENTESYLRVNSTSAGPSAAGTDAVAIGEGTNGNGTDSVAIGKLASVTSSNGVAVGRQAKVVNSNGVAVGVVADAGGPNSVAVGVHSDVADGADRGIAIGPYAASQADDSIAIGSGTSSTNAATAQGINSIAIGTDAQVGTGSTDSIAIGKNTSIANNCINSVLIGSDSSLTGSNDNTFLATPAFGYLGSVNSANQILTGVRESGISTSAISYVDNNASISGVSISSQRLEYQRYGNQVMWKANIVLSHSGTDFVQSGDTFVFRFEVDATAGRLLGDRIVTNTPMEPIGVFNIYQSNGGSFPDSPTAWVTGHVVRINDAADGRFAVVAQGANTGVSWESSTGISINVSHMLS